MQVKILEEHGYDSALLGMAYSFKDRAEDPTIWWEGKRQRAIERSVKLAPMEGGHNKFLESIQVWVDIEASRSWWSEFDTYRAGVTKQSESTMHTLAKRPPTPVDFENDTPLEIITAFISIYPKIKDDIAKLKCALPEGYLQRRIVCTNYKALANIIRQRLNHRLYYWNTFCNEIINQVQHPELLKGNFNNNGKL